MTAPLSGRDGRPTVVVLGSESHVGSGFRDRISPYADIRFATDEEELREAFPGAEILLAWDYDALPLVAQVWAAADRLEWIQVSGIGVDGLISPQLLGSDVTLTNVRGVTEHPIAELVLGTLLFWVKGMKSTIELQAENRWQHRETETLVGRQATVLGAGGVGREIAKVLSLMQMDVTVLARTERDDDDFGKVLAIDGLDDVLPATEFLVCALPLTRESRGLLGSARLDLLPHGARLINVGRGDIVDEQAILEVLTEGKLAAAALDVFGKEPLPADDPLWDAPNLLVTSHMAGDVIGWREKVEDRFLANLQRWLASEPLANEIDKSAL